MTNKNKLLEIDAIRGLAALGIVLFHYGSTETWPDYHPFSYFSYLDQCLQVFFLISGLVILISISRIKRSLDFIVNRFCQTLSYLLGFGDYHYLDSKHSRNGETEN